jgi:hypothetical protein
MFATPGAWLLGAVLGPGRLGRRRWPPALFRIHVAQQEDMAPALLSARKFWRMQRHRPPSFVPTLASWWRQMHAATNAPQARLNRTTMSASRRTKAVYFEQKTSEQPIEKMVSCLSGQRKSTAQYAAMKCNWSAVSHSSAPIPATSAVVMSAMPVTTRNLISASYPAGHLAPAAGEP